VLPACWTSNFPKINETKKLGIIVAIGNGILKLSSDETTQKIKEYAPILNNESKIKTTISKTEEALQEYLEFIE
jgi:hypothetical protein